MKILKLNILVFFCLLAVTTSAVQVKFEVNPATGALTSLQIEGDSCHMNWLMASDRSQFPWMSACYGWGLGFFTENGRTYRWEQPQERGTTKFLYGNVRIEIKRAIEDDDLVETYTFTNIARQDIHLTDVGIFTPWNDNYNTSHISLTSRCNTHIWAGESAAWVKAMRMCGTGKHLGLMITEGKINDYEIMERGTSAGASNERGVIVLNLPDISLKHGQSYTLCWRIFVHHGNDFFEQIIRRGGAVVSSSKYVYEVGEEAIVECKTANGVKTIIQKLEKPGKKRILFDNGKGWQTYADLFVVSSEKALIDKRAEFIRQHQQMNNPADPRYGAFMIYDNEGDSLLTWFPPKRGDLDESRERTGMAIFLARYYKRYPSAKLLDALERCATFYHDKLQGKNYRINSTVMMKAKNRKYNYSWMADFYFRMYDITRNKKYAQWGYGTLRSLFRQYGYNFYAIDYPVVDALQSLKKAGFKKERDTLLTEYIKTGDEFAKTGLDFPKSEMNYEQAIIGPAIQFLCELFLVTKDKKYLDTATEMMPGLESFNGEQPSYRMNDIAIRHWDGYWFGKIRQFGDVFPHYWSTITAGAFHYYALATGNIVYQRRAENIVRNNLCSFEEDGSATCAFIYPRRVNGQLAHYADAYANDQDFALAYYYLVNEAKK